MSRKYSDKLYCFSPPVMLATFTFEFAAAIYTVWRYKLNYQLRLIVSILLMLGTFQVAEYFVCGGLGVNARTWSKVGYVAITTLPPLGLHLIHVIAGKQSRGMVIGAYAAMTAFILHFTLVPDAFTGHQCTGNYVIFQLGGGLAKLYFTYYYLLLILGIGAAVYWSRNFAKSKLKKDKKKAESLKAMAVGYLLFMFPTTIANTINPETRRGIPSVMCGFAVLFAIVLFGYVAPRASAEKTHNVLEH